MYKAVCDCCGKVMESYIADCADAVFISKGEAFEGIFDREWNVFPTDAVTFNKRFEVNGEYKLYCPDCVEWDKENKCYKPKEKKQ